MSLRPHKQDHHTPAYRSRRATAVVTLLLSAVVAWWWFMVPDVPSADDGSPAERGAAQEARTGTPPLASSEHAAPPEESPSAAHVCPKETAEADRLAAEVADKCTLRLAQRGFCPAPVRFENEHQAAAQRANLRDLLAPCGLDPSQLVFECSENPCIALLDRAVIMAGAERCETLGTINDNLPGLDEQLPPEGIWSSWTPMMLDSPTDSVEAMRATGRFGARVARASEAIAGETESASGSCGQARSALRDLKSPSPCDALLTYWNCEPSTVELPPGTAERYLSHSQNMVDELLDECEVFAESNHVLDCSGVPCILLVDVRPGEDAEDVFCGRQFGSVVTDQARPEILSVWMYRGIDQPVFDRFHDEKSVRFEIARAQLEADRNRRVSD